MRLLFWRRKESQVEKSLTEQIEEAESELAHVTQDMQKETVSKGEIRSAILKFVVIMLTFVLYLCLFRFIVCFCFQRVCAVCLHKVVVLQKQRNPES